MVKCRVLIAVHFACLLATSHVWAEWHAQTQSIMGTEVSVTLWDTDAQHAAEAIDAVMELMRKIDQDWNPDAPGSELHTLNQQAVNTAFPVSLEMAQVIDRALYYSQLTDGAFDISFSSVGHLYDYRQGRAPSVEQTRQALNAVNYRLLKLDRVTPTVQFGHPQMRIDLGGIAKGYAVDRAIELLVHRGIEHASVSAGGDSRLLGDRRGRPWIVGIRNPRKDGGVALALPLTDIAFSTSGDYERYFIDPDTGQRIHHIINPRTGTSASAVISASVMGPRGFDTDPLSTTVFILGVERGLALINDLPDFDAIIIGADGVVHYSNGLVE
jgi:thiamine biosynthesis lipoprotein